MSDALAEGEVEAAVPLSLEERVVELFVARCAPCHTEDSSGGLSFEAGDGLARKMVGVFALEPCTDGPSRRVSAGDPEGSVLMARLLDVDDCGDRMPPTGEPLDETELARVREWIESLEDADAP